MPGVSQPSGALMPETLYSEMLGRLHHSSQRLLDSVRALETQLMPVLDVSAPTADTLAGKEPPSICLFLDEAEKLLSRLVLVEENLDTIRTRLIL